MGVLKDFDCSKVNRDTTVEGTTAWRIIRPGLAYCGYCRNRTCPAGNQNVVCNRGPGIHVVNDDLVSGVVKCPSCSSPVEMEYISIFQCTAVVTILSQEEQRTELKATGEEIVKIGRRAGLPMFDNSLMTIEAKASRSRDCVVS